LEGNRLLLERNLAAAGDFATFDEYLSLEISGATPRTQTVSFDGGRIFYRSTALVFSSAVSAGDVDNTALYKNSADSRIHWRDSGGVDRVLAYTSEIGNTVLVSEFITKEIPTGAVDGVNTAFTLANTAEAGTEQVYLNGLLQSPGATEDYTIAGATITFASAPVAGDKIRVSYIKA
jgi:hypothetical protein